MSRNIYERLSSRHLPIMSEADDGAPSGGGSGVTGDGASAPDPSPDTQLRPSSSAPNNAPTGGEVTPPAAPAPAQRDTGNPNGASRTDSKYFVEPVAPVASEQNAAQVFTEAEVNNRLAQQRAQFDRQIQNLKLQNAAIATGVQGADVLLERIDRKAIAYDDAGKPTNLADLLNAQREAIAQALGLAPATPAQAPAQTQSPAAPAIPQIPTTNGSGAPGGTALEEANLFAEGLFRK